MGGLLMSDELSGWKQIAGALGISTRTAKRWARCHGMPVFKRFEMVRASRVALVTWSDEKTTPRPTMAQESPEGPETPR